MRIHKLLALVVILVLTGSQAGCAHNDTKTNPTPKYQTIKARLYYGSQGNERLVYETRTVKFKKEQDKYAAVLTELFKGPVTKGLVRNIPEGTRVIEITRNDTDIIANLAGFQGFSGEMAEIFSEGSIVNTLTSFDEVKRVKILVDGQELIGLSGQPRGYMTEFTNPDPQS
jgi:spore germination protein GerM